MNLAIRVLSNFDFQKFHLETTLVLGFRLMSNFDLNISTEAIIIRKAYYYLVAEVYLYQFSIHDIQIDCNEYFEIVHLFDLIQK